MTHKGISLPSQKTLILDTNNDFSQTVKCFYWSTNFFPWTINSFYRRSVLFIDQRIFFQWLSIFFIDNQYVLLLINFFLLMVNHFYWRPIFFIVSSIFFISCQYFFLPGCLLRFLDLAKIKFTLFWLTSITSHSNNNVAFSHGFYLQHFGNNFKKRTL